MIYSKLKMLTLIFALLLLAGLLRAQTVTFKIYNKTGFDLDSVFFLKNYLGRIQNDNPADLTLAEAIMFMDGMPSAGPVGTIKGKKKAKPPLAFCGTGRYPVETGEFAFDIVMSESNSGYTLQWRKHG